ncbi:MSMEG_1061 family FMN-dependent PPOX-type flavoprotein [Biformimicrobium ophioploci]|uniref:Pyridoxamine 5'-phosphate oxidase family protein n=1 Tax=Biformimicrobium ophioploci TaxID=3036711 RepID=A0ABQ6LYU0_9GAMM|nr:MSMEG_1061 family FMN-dependent PPOX-type flavoprotein [Microbulbifer sp. NKW57]GMG87233.1 pyridoxamine 5'-phosphate oxidase family protein [Microbulbifer sp. NKW57]
MYEPKDVVSTPEVVQEVLGDVLFSQDTKCIDHIDAHCRAWIERSPFVVVSTYNARGQVDVAPKGDPVGSWKVLDEHTIAIPDRLGNNRADTFRNILETARIGLMFVVPRRREVVRVSGSAVIARDADLLESMTVSGKQPTLAIIVRVEEAMFHCGKAMIRSNMWTPEEWGPIDGLPTYGQALVDHGKLPIPVEDMQAGIIRNEENRLY